MRVWHGKHIESGDKVWGKDYDVEADYDLSHLKKLDHPLLLKFRETFRTGRFFHIVSDRQVWLYSDNQETLTKCQCSCERFLINDEERNVLEEHEVRVLVRSMVDAWIYLAENGISSNIYVSLRYEESLKFVYEYDIILAELICFEMCERLFYCSI